MNEWMRGEKRKAPWFYQAPKRTIIYIATVYRLTTDLVNISIKHFKVTSYRSYRYVKQKQFGSRWNDKLNTKNIGERIKHRYTVFSTYECVVVLLLLLLLYSSSLILLLFFLLLYFLFTTKIQFINFGKSTMVYG